MSRFIVHSSHSLCAIKYFKECICKGAILINSTNTIIILENRPVLRAALIEEFKKIGYDDVTSYSSYGDLSNSDSLNSFYFLAAHLVPLDVSVPSFHKRAISVVYGENFSSNCVHWWLERGAVGIWDLKDSFEDIQNGLVTANPAKPVLSRGIEKTLSTIDPNVGMHRLSKRELQVAKLLVLGNSTREVSKQLGVTEGTIKNQRKSVYRKLGIVRASQLPHAMGNGFAHLQK